MLSVVTHSMEDEGVWCRVVFVGPTGADLSVRALGGPGAPDLSLVDSLARTKLCALRLGGTIRLVEVCDDLAALLDLAGLLDVMGLRQVGGEAEGGEQVGVEEGVEFGDPVA